MAMSDETELNVDSEDDVKTAWSLFSFPASRGSFPGVRQEKSLCWQGTILIELSMFCWGDLLQHIISVK